jgi:hypothetical protein
MQGGAMAGIPTLVGQRCRLYAQVLQDAALPRRGGVIDAVLYATNRPGLSPAAPSGRAAFVHSQA